MKDLTDIELEARLKEVAETLEFTISAEELSFIVQNPNQVVLFVGESKGTRILTMASHPSDDPQSFREAVTTNVHAASRAGANKTVVALKRRQSGLNRRSVGLASFEADDICAYILNTVTADIERSPSVENWFLEIFSEEEDSARECDLACPS